MSDARWGDPREYDARDPGYELPRVYDPRDQDEHDLRDSLMHDLDLPRGDLSPQLRAGLRLWRRKQSAKWLALGRPRSPWVFASSVETPLDESNVRKAFNGVLDKAGLHRRGPHQMRHSFASLLLQAGEPIPYVSRQLGHRDSAMTLTVYAHWLPDSTARKGVDRLDDTLPAVAHSLHTASAPALRKSA